MSGGFYSYTISRETNTPAYPAHHALVKFSSDPECYIQVVQVVNFINLRWRGNMCVFIGRAYISYPTALPAPHHVSNSRAESISKPELFDPWGALAKRKSDLTALAEPESDRNYASRAGGCSFMCGPTEYHVRKSVFRGFLNAAYQWNAPYRMYFRAPAMMSLLSSRFTRWNAALFSSFSWFFRVAFGNKQFIYTLCYFMYMYVHMRHSHHRGGRARDTFRER